MQSELAWSPAFSASYISRVLERKWATKVWMSKSPIFFRLFLTPVLLYRCLQRQGWHFESLQSFPIRNVNAISCFLYLFFAGPAEFRWCLLRAKLRRLLLRDSGTSQIWDDLERGLTPEALTTNDGKRAAQLMVPRLWNFKAALRCPDCIFWMWSFSHFEIRDVSAFQSWVCFHFHWYQVDIEFRRRASQRLF